MKRASYLTCKLEKAWKKKVPARPQSIAVAPGHFQCNLKALAVWHNGKLSLHSSCAFVNDSSKVAVFKGKLPAVANEATECRNNADVPGIHGQEGKLREAEFHSILTQKTSRQGEEIPLKRLILPKLQ